MDKLIEKIKTIAQERFEEEDLADCFIVDIVPGSAKLEVFIDSDEGVKFWQCQKLSRHIEAYLDESGVLGTKYVLEVSSPGTDRPLKFKRQYPRNIGRKLDITLKSGEKVEGVLKSVENDQITVSVNTGKKKETEDKMIKFDEIESTKILITFSK